VARLGAVSAAVALALYGVLQAVDGVALKQVVDAWVRAPEAEKAARFASAETIRWLEWLPGTHIAEQPLHLISGGTEALLSGLHPNDRHVKHREVRLSTRQQSSGKW
jgi:hypothetical protein